MNEKSFIQTCKVSYVTYQRRYLIDNQQNSTKMKFKNKPAYSSDWFFLIAILRHRSRYYVGRYEFIIITYRIIPNIWYWMLFIGTYVQNISWAFAVKLKYTSDVKFSCLYGCWNHCLSISRLLLNINRFKIIIDRVKNLVDKYRNHIFSKKIISQVLRMHILHIIQFVLSCIFLI